MLVDGRIIGAEILAQVRASIAAPVVVRVVTGTPTPATRSYLSIKKARAEDAGMSLEIVELEHGAVTDEYLKEVRKGGASAVVVQLPLPSSVDTAKILNAIPVEKDADVLSDEAYRRFESGVESALVPPVVGAVEEILKRFHVSIGGKKILVVGEGRLVGKPVAAWLRLQHVEPIIINEADTIELHAPQADIIISGAGSAHIITPKMLKKGVVLIDAGASELHGVLVGDADPECVEVASVFTPVPGGMGPIVVACLFRNVTRFSSVR